MSEVQELIAFLDPDANRAVAEQALEIVEGLSGTPEGLASLRSAAQPLCKKLFRCAHNVSLSRSALTSLVNISQDARIAAHLVSTGACTTLLEYLHEGDTAHPDLVVMALSNLTQTDAGARSALQVGQGNLECSLMRRFVAIGLSPSSSSVLYEHAPGVVCNCTRLQQGRALLLDDAKASGFGALVATLASPSDVRRTGAAAAIKNVVVAAHQDGSLGKVVQDRERLRAMLAPINGQPPKELVDSVREDLATAAAFICRTEDGRKALMAVGGHETLRKGYEFEEHSGTMQAMEEAARSLMGVSEEGEADAADAVDGASAPQGMMLMS